MVLPQLLLALYAVPVGAGASRDVYFEQTTVTSTDGHAPGPGVVSRVWYSGRKMRMEAAGAVGPAFILRLDLGKAYRIDPSERTTLEIDLERLRARSQLDLALAGDLMGGSEEDAARTAALPTPRIIAGYSCRGYRIRAGSTVMDLYVAPSIPLGIDAFADFLDWSGASQALSGLLGQLRKLPGFPLETRARVNAMDHVRETVSTVTAVKVGPLPPSLFSPPKDFPVRAEEPAREP